MIISHSRKFVFVHIHKTAGETVTHALLPYLGRTDLVLGGTKLGNLRNLYYRRTHNVAKHSSAPRIRTFIGGTAWESYFSFAFVRDPIDRMRSLYSYYERMAAMRQDPSVRNLAYSLPLLRSGDPLGWPGMKAYLEAGSFSEFIRHPKLYQDPGASRQFDMVSDGEKVIVDRIGKFEALAEEFRDIAETLDIRSPILPWINLSRNSAVPQSDIGPDDSEHLFRKYEKDFVTFGYA